ncbi:MAG: ABC transporter ATP-binding protein [Acidimicrobiales bacterium]
MSLNRSAEPIREEHEALANGHMADNSRGDPGVSPAVLTIELRKEFRTTTALGGLSMTVGRGEVFGFLGPNGAGKTTAVKLLLGLVRPSGGEAMVLGAPAGDRETRRRIGYLPELFRFQSWLTASEVLMLHCRLIQLPRGRAMSAIDEVLETVGLAERRGDKVGTFSKGMQQRLGLAVALVGDPDLVILDEPTSALDPVGRHDVRGIISRVRDRGATVFLNTHLLEEAEHVCDRVCVIDRGRSIATGELVDLLGRSSSVRLKVAGLSDDDLAMIARFGDVARDNEWLTVARIQADEIPALVAAVVSAGGRIGAVIPEQQTLEERFLELLGKS